jgi:hypothetical protein
MAKIGIRASLFMNGRSSLQLVLICDECLTWFLNRIALENYKPQHYNILPQKQICLQLLYNCQV